MLRTTINWKTSGEENVTRYLHIANVSYGRIADYRYTLYTEDWTSICTGMLKRYPRWTEPVAGLVVRILCLAVSRARALRHATNHRPDITSLEVAIDLVPGGIGAPRRLETVLLTLQGTNGTLQYNVEHLVPCTRPVVFNERENNLYFIAVRALCRAVFDADDVLPIPEPFNPPFHVHAGRKYVRLSEIPEPAKSIFGRRYGHYPAPLVPGECTDNVVDAIAWQTFVGD
jgi:hypothetical protein